MKLLIVEDDLLLQEGLALALTNEGYALEDRINGLDYGADDYLVKPFALAELQAHVHAPIRRYQGHSDNLLSGGDITLNLQTQQILMLARAGQAMTGGHYDTVYWSENIIVAPDAEESAGKCGPL